MKTGELKKFKDHKEEQDYYDTFYGYLDDRSNPEEILKVFDAAIKSHGLEIEQFLDWNGGYFFNIVKAGT